MDSFESIRNTGYEENSLPKLLSSSHDKHYNDQSNDSDDSR